jgi:sugar lactone lactonase YvrE
VKPPVSKSSPLARLKTQTLYWADSSNQRLESSNVDGTNRMVIAEVAAYDIAITSDGVLYFGKFNGRRVQRLDSRDGSTTTVIVLERTITTGIQVFDPLRYSMFVFMNIIIVSLHST